MKTFFLFDGTDSEQNESHAFVAVCNAKGHGCDCYFDGVGGIAEVIDWVDGNGIIAHGDETEESVVALATAKIRGCQV